MNDELNEVVEQMLSTNEQTVEQISTNEQVAESSEVEQISTKKTVNLSMTINDYEYSGDVIVDTENETVDLDNLNVKCGDRQCLFVDAHPTYATYRGYSYARVSDLLTWEALRLAGLGEEFEQCDYTDFWAPDDYIVKLSDGDLVFDDLAFYFDDYGEYFYVGDIEERQVRFSDGNIGYKSAPECWFENRHYCEHCDCYIDDDSDYWGDGYCVYCHDEEEDDDDGDYDGIIEDYCESHEHSPIFFGDYKGEFAGLGFELEVDCSSSTQCRNGETAEGLCGYCGLRSNEVRYAHDGSLNHGFEIISQPHTVKAFWDNADKWRKMLSYLASRGYSSHDAGTCGLHVHVSREMFGSTEKDQDRAISKVYVFFDENWDDIVKVSRRTSFNYCDKNQLSSYVREDSKLPTKYDKWKKSSKGCGSHYVALNNINENTFEYRLGRGTLNAWSFFSWIDFIITITRNAKRITIEQVTSNDLLSWLGGIRESTAKYIYKRGAFRKQMVALFPNIEWETDLTDN